MNVHCLVFPALRALEGHLKSILDKHSISVENNGFYMFCKNNTTDMYCLKHEYSIMIGNHKEAAYVQQAYNYFSAKRHVLFHWNCPEQGNDLTKCIDKISEARIIIQDTLNLIEKYYE